MNKYFVLLIACATFVIASCDNNITRTRTIISLPPDVNDKVREALPKCCSKEDEEEMITTIREAKQRDDPKFQTFMYCLCKETGYITEDGKIIIDKASSVFPDKNVMLKVFSECDKQVGDTPIETTFKIYNCFQKTSPFRIAL